MVSLQSGGEAVQFGWDRFQPLVSSKGVQFGAVALQNQQLAPSV